MEHDIETMTWEEVREHLSVAAVDVSMHRQELKEIPHREADGLAVYPQLETDVNDDMVNSRAVTYKMAERWGLTPDQVLDEALAVAQERHPLRIEALGAVLQEMMPFEDMPAPVPDAGLVMLSNRQSFLGAGALFYPGALDQAAEKMGGSFYILPSSKHEVLLYRDDGSRERAGLEEMVRSINESEVKPEDVLSNTVYHYDAASRKLEKASTFEKRMERAEAKGERPDSVLKKLEAGKEKASGKARDRRTATRPKDKKKDTPAR